LLEHHSHTFVNHPPIYWNNCAIQVLFKNLGVDMKDVTPTSLLKDRKREFEGNPDFSNKDVGASQSQMITDIKSGLVPPVNQLELPLEVTNPSNTGAHPHMLSQVCSYVLLVYGDYLFLLIYNYFFEYFWVDSMLALFICPRVH